MVCKDIKNLIVIVVIPKAAVEVKPECHNKHNNELTNPYFKGIIQLSRIWKG